MYKQCIEIISAQGTNPTKSFSVLGAGQSSAKKGFAGNNADSKSTTYSNKSKTNASSPGNIELKKTFDAAVKGNIFQMTGHKIQWPPVAPSSGGSQALNSGRTSSSKAGFEKASGSKQAGPGATAANGAEQYNHQQPTNQPIVHQFINIQLFLGSAPADSFQLEIQVRDKQNTRRRIMFTDGSKDIIQNSMHVRIPNSFIKRDQWLNLCIDLDSIVKECFSGNKTEPGLNAAGSKGEKSRTGPRARSRGHEDMKQLSKKQAPDPGQIYSGAVVGPIPQSRVAHKPTSTTNAFKHIEYVQVEGHFKLKKIFSTRSQIPLDPLEDELHDMVEAERLEKAKVEGIPQKLDYHADVNYVNQVLTYPRMQAYIDFGKINQEDSLVINGSSIRKNQGNSTQSQERKIPIAKKQRMQDASHDENTTPQISHQSSSFYNKFNSKRNSHVDGINNQYAVTIDDDETHTFDPSTPSRGNALSTGPKRTNKFNQSGQSGGRQEKNAIKSQGRVFSPRQSQNQKEERKQQQANPNLKTAPKPNRNENRNAANGNGGQQLGSANSVSRQQQQVVKTADSQGKRGFKNTNNAREAEPQPSPPTFLKGISSHMNLKDTKYSNHSGKGNYISENTGYELQEVKEQTIYEEENDHASAVWQSRGQRSAESKERVEAQHPYDVPGSSSQVKSKQLTKKQQNLAKQNQIYGGGQAQRTVKAQPKERRAIEQRQQFMNLVDRDTDLPDPNRASNISGKHDASSTALTLTNNSGAGGGRFNDNNMGGSKLAHNKNRNQSQKNRQPGTNLKKTNQAEDKSLGRDPYQNPKASNKQKSKKEDKYDMASQKSFKMTSNFSNLDDSVGGVIGASLTKVQGQAFKNKENHLNKTHERQIRMKQNQRQTQGTSNQPSSQGRGLLQLNQMHTQNKSPDIVGNRNLLIQKQTSKERLNDRSSNGGNNNNQYSATKSQANVTNNNFAKFSSSGYTNNAFLLMSGHHDFTQNDFNAQIQQSGEKLPALGQDTQNFKSTSKSRKQNQQSQFLAFQNVTHNNLYDGAQHQDQSQLGTIQNDVEEQNEIEESIIEEDIQTHNMAQSPASPLITSKTKGKGKMGLFMMKPPKPFKQNTADSKGDFQLQYRNAAPFQLKFDTLNSSIKGEDKLDTNHITEDINQTNKNSNTQRNYNQSPEKIAMEINQTSDNEINETYDEMYQIPSTNGGVPTAKKKTYNTEDQRRPFSPPIKQQNMEAQKQDPHPNLQSSISFKNMNNSNRGLDQDDAPPLDSALARFGANENEYGAVNDKTRQFSGVNKLIEEENPFKAATTGAGDHNIFKKLHFGKDQNNTTHQGRTSLQSTNSDNKDMLSQKAPKSRSLSKNKSKQLIFDKQLKCYYDPSSNEYFEMVPKQQKQAQ